MVGNSPCPGMEKRAQCLQSISYSTYSSGAGHTETAKGTLVQVWLFQAQIPMEHSKQWHRAQQRCHLAPTTSPGHSWSRALTQHVQCDFTTKSRPCRNTCLSHTDTTRCSLPLQSPQSLSKVEWPFCASPAQSHQQKYFHFHSSTDAQLPPAQPLHFLLSLYPYPCPSFWGKSPPTVLASLTTPLSWHPVSGCSRHPAQHHGIELHVCCSDASGQEPALNGEKAG